MTTDEKSGTPSGPSDNTGNTGNNSSNANDSRRESRDSRAPGPRRKRRRSTRTSRPPENPNAGEARQVEEQSLGPGRKKRIFKRRKPAAEEGAPQASAPAVGGGGEDRSGNRRGRRTRRPSTGERPNGDRGRGEGSDSRDTRAGGRGGDRSRGGANQSRDRGERRNERDAAIQKGREIRQAQRDSIPPMAINDNAPDGTFGESEYTDLSPRPSSRNVPAYVMNDAEEIVSSENFFSGRQDWDFASMTEAELDFLKPHEANEEDMYAELPVLDVSKPPKGKMMDIVGVKTHRSGTIDPYDCEDLVLSKGDEVVVETDRGLAIGEVMVSTTRRWVTRDEPRVFRAATINDMRQRDRNLQKAAEAFEMCQKSIARLRLVMKLVEVMYLHGGNKAVFYFMAEGRVDFRQLVKELAKDLHIRVEMRQIGVRDASRMIGGLGTCGLSLCCSRYIREFAPVSIRMAKDQDLVLNPEKVSGQCGRLMCCLAYEEEVYKEKGKKMPRVGKIVETPEGCGRVRDRDILRGLVRVELESVHGLKTFEITDIRPVKPAGEGDRRGNRGESSDAGREPAPPEVVERDVAVTPPSVPPESSDEPTDEIEDSE